MDTAKKIINDFYSAWSDAGDVSKREMYKRIPPKQKLLVQLEHFMAYISEGGIRYWIFWTGLRDNLLNDIISSLEEILKANSSDKITSIYNELIKLQILCTPEYVEYVACTFDATELDNEYESLEVYKKIDIESEKIGRELNKMDVENIYEEISGIINWG